MTQNSDPLARAQNTAHEWLATIGESLGTHDRRYTYRVLRAWLHTLRDRLTVEAAAHFAAQLPELLRGTFYDGWVPSKVPVRYSCDDCVDRMAAEATIRRTDVAHAIHGVSEGMRGLLSPGSLDHALDRLPRDLRAMFTPPTRTTAEPAPGTPRDELERKVESLVDAVADLSRELRSRSVSGQRLPARDPEALAAADDMMLPHQGLS